MRINLGVRNWAIYLGAVLTIGSCARLAIAQETIPQPPAATTAPNSAPENPDLNQVQRSETGDNRARISDLEQSIKLNPLNASAHTELGIAYLNSGKETEAIEQLNQALRLEPGNANAYLNRGIAQLQASDETKAITDLDQATKLEPQNPEAYFQLCQAYQKKKQLNQARENCERATQLNPNHALSYMHLADILLKVHDDQRALINYQLSAELFLATGDQKNYERVKRKVEEQKQLMSPLPSTARPQQSSQPSR